MSTVTVAHFGLGPIGLESVRLLAEKPWARIVGAIDIAPEKVGRSLKDLTGFDELADVQVNASADQLLERTTPDVVIHAAGSTAAQSLEQVEPFVRAGVSIISSCEELLLPQLKAPEAAERFDALCRESGARILGTGVNPGFVLDVLPVCATGVCRNVRTVYGQRVVNASKRRMPLQRKVGSGLDPDEFRQRFQQGRMGHAGFKESLGLIAHALGWGIDTPITETCEPVIADQHIRTDYFEVETGQTCGLHQRVTAEYDKGRRIELDLQMYLDAPEPHDTVQIDGDPPVTLTVPDGVAGDTATVATLVNAIPRLLTAAPGLRLSTELPLPRCAGDTAAAVPST